MPAENDAGSAQAVGRRGLPVVDVRIDDEEQQRWLQVTHETIRFDDDVATLVAKPLDKSGRGGQCQLWSANEERSLGTRR